MIRPPVRIAPDDKLSLLCEEEFEKAKDLLNLKKRSIAVTCPAVD